MSTRPEQDPESKTEQLEAFVPAYKSPEVALKTPEQIQAESADSRAEVANKLNAEFPQSGVDKLLGRDMPHTEVSIAQGLAEEENKVFDAEKSASEKAEADAAAEKARVEQETEQARLEKEKQAQSDQERAETQAEETEHQRQKEQLRKSLTRPSQIWVAMGQHVNNPDYLNESQIKAQLEQFDSDWLAKQHQQRLEKAGLV